MELLCKAFLLLSLAVSAINAISLHVIAPNAIREGHPTKISVVTFGIANGRIVQLRVASGPVSNVAITGNVGEGTVTVTKAMLGEPDAKGRHYVNLRAVHGNTVAQQKILVNLKSGSVFIMTDKPVYRNDELVHIKVFTVTDELNSKDMDIRVDILNPDDLILHRKEDQTVGGIFSFAYKLPKYAKDGNWTVAVKYGLNYAANTTTIVEVKEYVLPTFNVKVDMLTNFAAPATTEVKGIAKAQYSFGPPLTEGNIRIEYRLADDDTAILIPSAVHHQKISRNGRTEFTLNLKEHLYDKGTTFAQVLGKKLHVEVTVTETASGIKETAVNRDCTFANSPYKISFENNSWSFDEYPFDFQAKVSHHSGLPAAVVPCVLTATAYQSNGRAGAPERVDNVMTTLQGWVTHTFNLPAKTAKLEIKVETNKPNQPKTVRTFVVTKMQANAYMHIHTEDANIQVGQSSNFGLSLSKSAGITTTYVTIMSGGRIISTKPHVVNGAQMTHFQVSITVEMSPAFRMVVWYVDGSRNLIATSKNLRMEEKCRNEVEIGKDDSTVPLPETSMTFKFKAHPGTNISYMAVDKAVYFVNDKNILDRDHFFERIEDNDLGCGLEGGKTPSQLFTYSGLSFISNSGTQTSFRGSMDCLLRDPDGAAKRKKRSVPTAGGNDVQTLSRCCSDGGDTGVNANPLPEEAARNAYCATEMAAANLPSTSNKCKNAFFKCCVSNATAVYKDSLPEDARSAGTDVDEEEAEFIKNAGDIQSRINFPETWMISTKKIPATGELSEVVSLPGSITTWVVHAVGMSKTEGMCIAKELELVVKKDLFIKLHLPTVAVLDEHVILKATIYNNQRSAETVYVKAVGVDGLCTEAEPGAKMRLATRAKILPQSNMGVQWVAVPTRIGSVSVIVEVYGSYGTDKIEKKMTVVPSGSREEAKVLVVALNPEGTAGTSYENNNEGLSATIIRNGNTQTTRVKLGLPKQAYIIGQYIDMKLSGNPIMEVVDAQVDNIALYKNHPSNCGEQTMSKLGQTVYGTLYYKHVRSGDITAATEQTQINNINEGIDIMLNKYRRTDGSFTVWTGTPPMLWLTAFTMKTFYSTKDLSDKMRNNPHVLTKARDFILGKQHATGVWIDGGAKVYHTDMLGGVGKDQYLFSSYMLLCLLESELPANHGSITKGINFLFQNVNQGSSTYQLAQFAYVLGLAKHSRANEVLGWLKLKARSIDNASVLQKYWVYTTKPGVRWTPTNTQLELEANAYGLLALVANGDIAGAAPHVEWIIRQKRSGGLFPSTQANVVTLQALTFYSEKAPNHPLNIRCTLDNSNTPLLLNEDNLNTGIPTDLSQKVDQTVHLACTGTGTGTVTFGATYYAKKSAEDRCAFIVTAVANPTVATSKKEVDITVCAKTKVGVPHTGMAIIDIGLGSGYKVNPQRLTKMKDQGELSLFEVFGRSVALYFDKIDHQEKCITIRANSDVEVKNVRPVPVKVYDYYEPDEKSCTVFYNPHGKKNKAIDTECDTSETRKTCKCLENQCPKKYGYNRGDVKPLTRDELNHFACLQMSHSRPDYVFKAQALDDPREDDSGTRYVEFNILEVYNQDETVTEQLRDTEATFFIGGSCPSDSPRIEFGKVYMIMGKGAIGEGVKYFFNHHSYVVELYDKDEIKRITDATMKRLAKQQKSFLNRLSKQHCQENP